MYLSQREFFSTQWLCFLVNEIFVNYTHYYITYIYNIIIYVYRVLESQLLGHLDYGENI